MRSSPLRGQAIDRCPSFSRSTLGAREQACAWLFLTVRLDVFVGDLHSS